MYRFVFSRSMSILVIIRFDKDRKMFYVAVHHYSSDASDYSEHLIKKIKIRDMENPKYVVEELDAEKVGDEFKERMYLAKTVIVNEEQSLADIHAQRYE